MGFQKYLYGISFGFQCDFFGMSIIFLLDSYDISNVSIFYDISMRLLWEFLCF